MVLQRRLSYLRTRPILDRLCNYGTNKQKALSCKDQYTNCSTIKLYFTTYSIWAPHLGNEVVICISWKTLPSSPFEFKRSNLSPAWILRVTKFEKIHQHDFIQHGFYWLNWISSKMVMYLIESQFPVSRFFTFLFLFYIYIHFEHCIVFNFQEDSKPGPLPCRALDDWAQWSFLVSNFRTAIPRAIHGVPNYSLLIKHICPNKTSISSKIFSYNLRVMESILQKHYTELNAKVSGDYL